jgi:hypothetical protein
LQPTSQPIQLPLSLRVIGNPYLLMPPLFSLPLGIPHVKIEVKMSRPALNRKIEIKSVPSDMAIPAWAIHLGRYLNSKAASQRNYKEVFSLRL